MSLEVEEVQVAQLLGASGATLTHGGDAGATASVLTILLGNVIQEDVVLRARFRTYVENWRRDTAHLSSASKTVMHPAYQAIIGMGEKALPLILDELRTHGGHWFWALHAITQEDPARDCRDFSDAVRAWLAWGRARRHIA